MFGIYFGKYLIDNGIITEKQYSDLLRKTKNSKVRMGLLAIETGLMTEEQAMEVNHLQQQEDKRFGDIAVEMGYLMDDDVIDLLDRQGDPYLLFIQQLLDDGLMTLDQIRKELINYRKAMGFTALDIDAIKTGDVDRIIPIFLKSYDIPTYIKNYILLTSRNIVRFVDRFFRMEKVQKITEYETPLCAMQHVVGEYRFYVAICGDDKGIEKLARGFASTVFPSDIEVEVEDTLDATGEFINCNDGLYATGLSDRNINLIVETPVMKSNPVRLSAKDHMYRVPLFIEEQPLDLIVCFEDDSFSMEDI